MPDRIAKVNKHIQRTFGEILQVEADLPKDAMVTVAGVETAKNLKTATVWLSIFPETQANKVIKKLKKQLYDLQGSLNEKIRLKPSPRITLTIDHGAQHAENIDRRLKELV
jgi:ribosome-binding factor A